MRPKCKLATSLWRTWRNQRESTWMSTPYSKISTRVRSYSRLITCIPCSSLKRIGPSIMSSRIHSRYRARWKSYSKNILKSIITYILQIWAPQDNEKTSLASWVGFSHIDFELRQWWFWFQMSPYSCRITGPFWWIK